MWKYNESDDSFLSVVTWAMIYKSIQTDKPGNYVEMLTDSDKFLKYGEAKGITREAVLAEMERVIKALNDKKEFCDALKVISKNNNH